MTDEAPKRGRPKGSKNAPRKTRKLTALQTLEQIALDSGYMPGEFQLRRLMEGVSRVREWDSYLNRGVCPPDFKNFETANRIRDKMANAVAEEERELLPYFHAKKKHTDVTASITGEITLLDLLKRAG